MFRSIIFIFKYLSLLSTILLFTGCAMLAPKAKPDYTVEVADMDFVFVKGGTFQMGSNDRPDEQPIHNVTIQDLFVGMYEVTFDQYDRFCAATNCEAPSDMGWGRADRPVINVNWNDANIYASWLSEQTGHQFRLPSEAEWEYFARAGTTTKYWTGDSFPKNAANCRNCSNERPKMTVPVGMFAPNHWKLFDTTGNAQEWTLDDYQKDYINAPSDDSSVSVTNAPGKSLRGGAWGYNVTDMTSTSRDYSSLLEVTNHIGFRLVMIPNIKTQILEAK